MSEAATPTAEGKGPLRRLIAVLRRPPGIAATTARAIILWSCAATLFLTALSYMVVAERAERQVLSRLSEYIAQRGRAESQIFRAAQANLAHFGQAFLALYEDPTAYADPDFDSYYEEGPDGAIRLREIYFTGWRAPDGTVRRGTSAFMGRKRPELTPELKRRLVIAYELVARLGPAWVGPFANLHASLPENALINHWPTEPWGLVADPALDMIAGAVIKATLQSENPDRAPVWSGLYYDLTAETWVVTYQLPVDAGGRHLVNPSHDILLDDLIARLAGEHPDGARNLILGPGGELVAQPERMAELMESRGILNVKTLGDPDLLETYRAIGDAGGPAAGGRIIESEALDAYLAVTEIEGPGWWFITVYPRALVTASAHQSAAIVLLLGLVLSVLIAGIVHFVLRNRVQRPIGELERACARLAAGNGRGIADADFPLPDARADEIGLLARSFRSMAARVTEASELLEQTVATRTAELRCANEKLEALTLRDALTGAFNRRAFDLDLAEAIATAREQGQIVALIICDLDHFKLYNDSYGHLAGDQVLSLVVSTISQSLGAARLYRYGGEELATILTADEGDCMSIGLQMVRRVAALSVPHLGSPCGVVTLSAGLAFTGGPVRSAEDLLKAADGELYRAKAEGRNRLAISDAAVQSVRDPGPLFRIG